VSRLVSVGSTDPSSGGAACFSRRKWDSQLQVARAPAIPEAHHPLPFYRHGYFPKPELLSVPLTTRLNECAPGLSGIHMCSST
jgi:hypothetical protein